MHTHSILIDQQPLSVIAVTYENLLNTPRDRFKIMFAPILFSRIPYRTRDFGGGIETAVQIAPPDHSRSVTAPSSIVRTMKPMNAIPTQVSGPGLYQLVMQSLRTISVQKPLTQTLSALSATNCSVIKYYIRGGGMADLGGLLCNTYL